MNKTRIDAALEELLTCNPPHITVREERSGLGRPTKFYELAANKVNYANNKQPRGFAVDVHLHEQSEVREVSEQSHPEPELVRQVRIVSDASKTPETRASLDSSLTSHSSQVVVESEEF